MGAGRAEPWSARDAHVPLFRLPLWAIAIVLKPDLGVRCGRGRPPYQFIAALLVRIDGQVFAVGPYGNQTALIGAQDFSVTLGESA